MGNALKSFFEEPSQNSGLRFAIMNYTRSDIIGKARRSRRRMRGSMEQAVAHGVSLRHVDAPQLPGILKVQLSFLEIQCQSHSQ